MRIIKILAMILATNVTFAQGDLDQQLANFVIENKQKVLKIAKNRYEYTYYSFPVRKEKCVAQQSQVGVVGVCLVTGLANEENVIAHFAVNITSDYAGTGDKQRKISVTLIDYEI